ncbi:small multi-drug export protein [Streptomyces parvus]|uniref:small multi-drug export protein n=1 Tax=Streptomyces TaxID=1883 RepID=UPI00067CAD97|nr:small multi-drug export protein [Streptomyces sp. PgraA7]MCC8481225.1 small multi-drug export protein [Streptomyces globisporus]MYX03673.1 hypothetical protein [Streptomyces sp. SID8378]SNB85405.1 Uncharacterized membrane protein [Streptomyces sp. PgraA7]
MLNFAWAVLAGFALGTPAVPFGLSISLAPPVALVAVLLGAAGCLLSAVFAAGWLRTQWLVRRSKRRPVTAGSPPENRRNRLDSPTGRRARRVVNRYGVIGFGIIGPALFGTWGSAVLGTALGLPRWRLIGWLMAGVTLWCTVMLLASEALIDAFGLM